MTEEEKSLYECKSPTTGKWGRCTMASCARERRINQDVDMVLRLEHYKSKLDAGLELSDIEQADLEAIGKHIMEVVQSFLEALQEAFQPIIAALTQAISTFWDGLPEQMKVELMSAAAPRLELNPELFGELATPYDPNSPQVIGVPPMQQPYTRLNTFPQPYQSRRDLS